MKHALKHKLFLGFAVAGFVISFVTATLPTSAFAASTTCDDPTSPSFTSSCCPSGQTAVQMQGSRSCCPTSQALSTATDDGARAKICFFGKYINPVVNLLSALVGIVVVIGIVLGAVQFGSSAGDPQKAANGKNHIRNALLGLLAYLLLYAFLQFMIPGGSLQ